MATKAKKQDNAKAAEWMYEIVRRPIVTEKTANGYANNQVTFEVLATATNS